MCQGGLRFESPGDAALQLLGVYRGGVRRRHAQRLCLREIVLQEWVISISWFPADEETRSGDADEMCEAGRILTKLHSCGLQVSRNCLTNNGRWARQHNRDRQA